MAIGYSGIPVSFCAFKEDMIGDWFLLGFLSFVRHVLVSFFEITLSGDGLDQAGSIMRRQKENRGMQCTFTLHDGEGADFVIDAGSMCGRQSAMIERGGISVERRE